MPSEIREGADPAGPGSLLNGQPAARHLHPARRGMAPKSRETASPRFPPVMCPQQFSPWPSADGLQGQRHAAVPLCSLVRYANASVDISFAGKKKLKKKYIKMGLLTVGKEAMKTRTAEL